MQAQKTSVSLNNLKITIKYFFLFFCVRSFILPAQNIDSLKVELNKTTNDTSRLNILFILAENIEDEKIWIRYNDTALSLAEKLSRNANSKIALKGKAGIASAYNNTGFFFSTLGDVEKAIEYYQKSLKILQEINDLEGVAFTFNNLKLFLRRRGRNKGRQYY